MTNDVTFFTVKSGPKSVNLKISHYVPPTPFLNPGPANVESAAECQLIGKETQYQGGARSHIINELRGPSITSVSPESAIPLRVLTQPIHTCWSPPNPHTHRYHSTIVTSQSPHPSISQYYSHPPIPTPINTTVL